VSWAGTDFKSTLEARLAILYDVLCFDFEYEAITFNLKVCKGLSAEINNRQVYTPDFLVKDRSEHVIIEAKGPEPTEQEELLLIVVRNFFGFPAYFQRYMFDPYYLTFDKHKAPCLEGMRASRTSPTVRWIECRYCNCISRGVGAYAGPRNNKTLTWTCVWCGKAEPNVDRTPKLLRAYKIAREYDFHTKRAG